MRNEVSREEAQRSQASAASSFSHLHSTLGYQLLRHPRKPQFLQLVQTQALNTPGGGVWERFKKENVTIRPGWIQQKSREDYRRAIKQAMLIAAFTGRAGLEDMRKMAVEGDSEDLRALNRLPQAKLLRSSKLLDHQGVLVKRSRKLGREKVQQFTIEENMLKVFKGSAATPKHQYDLGQAQAVLESKGSRSDLWLGEKFFKDYYWRVVIVLGERSHGPVFLYTSSVSEAKQWYRAARYTKYFGSADECSAMQGCITFMRGMILKRAWDELCRYANWAKARAREYEKTLLVKRPAPGYPHLSAGDDEAVSMGMPELEDVNADVPQEPQTGADHAVTIFSEPMREHMITSSIEAPGVGTVQRWRPRKEFLDDPSLDHKAALRHLAISRLQTKFKRLCQKFPREDRSWLSPLETLRSPTKIACSYETLSMADALAASLSDGKEPFDVQPRHLIQSPSLPHSKENKSLSFRSVKVSNGLEHLCFSQDPGNYVRLDQINSVVLHTAPHKAGFSGGSWFTIHGPRVRFGWRPETAAGSSEDRLLTMKLTVGQCHLPKKSSAVEGAQYSASPSWEESFLVVHLLGRRFWGQRTTGEQPVFQETFELKMPLSGRDADLAALETATVSVGVWRWNEVPALQSCVWSGLTSLRSVLSHIEVQTLSTASESCGSATVALKSTRPEDGASSTPDAWIKLASTVQLQEVEQDDTACFSVSPELLGCGSISTLYTSHLGAWYRQGQLHEGQACNIVELLVQALTFPDSDDPGQGGSSKYRVSASIRNTSRATQPLHRPKDKWSKILPCSPNVINYQGSRLLLPLPPGVWELKEKPEVEVCVHRSSVREASFARFADLIPHAKKSSCSLPTWEVVYQSKVKLDELFLNQPSQVDLSLRSTSSPFSARLSAELILRDRSYLKLVAASNQDASICVGEKAVIQLEERFSYPSSKEEYAQRLLPGDIDEDLAEMSRRMQNAGPSAVLMEAARSWRMPLRDPFFSHEYVMSEFGRLQSPEYAFKRRSLPVDQDVTPYKFVLPESEATFLKTGLPGIFWRILDQMAEEENCKRAVLKVPGQAGPSVPIVTELTHSVRHAACTVLAVYPDSTCDVDLSPLFLWEWSRKPHRQLALPGRLVIKKAKGTERMKVGLRGVPLEYVCAVKSGSFNLYDAAFHDSTEAFQVSKATRLQAGPLPADAGPASTYEWSLHLHAESEEDMYSFVAHLRQVAQVAVKKNEAVYEEAQAEYFRDPNDRSGIWVDPWLLKGGTLEVSLVEICNLRGFMSCLENGPDDIKKFGACRCGRDIDYLEGLSLCASVRLLSYKEPSSKTYRGLHAEKSPYVDGHRPSWFTHSGGGFVVKLPPIDPALLSPNELYLEILLLDASGHRMSVLHLPLAGRQAFDTADASWSEVPCLCDPKRSFKNFWLPLVKVNSKGEPEKEMPLGQIHILALWSDSKMSGANALRRSLQGQGAPTEIIPYRQLLAFAGNTQTRFNPNTVSGSTPLTVSQVQTGHIQGAMSSLLYIASFERKAKQIWDDFEEKVQERTPNGLASLEGADAEGLDELCCLGVPRERRRQVWLDIAGTELLLGGFKYPLSFVSDPSPAVHAYSELVELGRSNGGAAIWQLQEDVAVASTWHSCKSVDTHLPNLARAQRVCTALVAFSWEGSGTDCNLMDDNLSIESIDLVFSVVERKYLNFKDQRQGSEACGVAYCESLLVVAYWLLIALQLGAPETAASEAEDEARVFWLLATLIGAPCNQVLRDFFGSPRISGAYDDVYVLEACLRHHDPELSLHLSSIGLHLSMVFVPAFQRLFAMVLPPATLFAFWDLFIAESRRPSTPSWKPRRHFLIDLAFGAVQACRQQLLSCNSPCQARDCLLFFFECLHDVTLLVDTACFAEHFLWNSSAARSADSTAGSLKRYLGASEASGPVDFRDQPQLAKDIEIDRQLWEASHEKLRVQNAHVEQLVKEGTEGPLTTKFVATEIIPVLHSLSKAGGGTKAFGGSLQPVSRALQQRQVIAAQALQVEPAKSSFFSFSWLTGRKPPKPPAKLAREDTDECQAVSVPAPPGSEAEPAHFTKKEWLEVMFCILGPKVEATLGQIYDAFTQSGSSRFSQNDFLVALLCFSQGTVCEKALALFDLYSSAEQANKVPHIITATCGSPAAIVAAVEGKEAGGAMHDAYPSQDDIKKYALHFRVFSNGSMLGEAFVPGLEPYVTAIASKQLDDTLLLWGGLPEAESARLCIGKLQVSIQWVAGEDNISPARARVASKEVGQLCIRLLSVELDPNLVPEPGRANPSVTVVTYDEGGQEAGIEKRPAGPEAEKQHIHFAETMSSDSFGEFGAEGVTHGWQGSTGLWVWGRKWGEQYSPENYRMHAARLAMESVAKSANTISLQACRLLTQSILSRSLASVTNRQAVLMADLSFNRMGAVAGILDAVLIEGDTDMFMEFQNISHLTTEFGRRGIYCLDIRRELVLMQEAHLAQRPGSLALFARSGLEEEVFNLQALEIQDPFPGQRKAMWIRYARAGDGQRFNVTANIDGSGNFKPTEVPLDMDNRSTAGRLQMTLTREDFIASLLACPLADSLERLSSKDPFKATGGRVLSLLVTARGAREELRLSFSEQGGNAGQRGSRHGLKVYPTDSIFQIKELVARACKLEAAAEQNLVLRSGFQDLASKITSVEDMVLLWVPAKVLPESLREHLEEMRISDEDLEPPIQAELKDPSCWVPLSLTRTLESYTQVAHRLEICPKDMVASSRQSAMHIKEAKERRQAALSDFDTEFECSGWAIYRHPKDGNSPEWRQAILQAVPDASDASQQRFWATFMYSPLCPSGGYFEQRGNSKTSRGTFMVRPQDISSAKFREWTDTNFHTAIVTELDQDSVLFTAANPRMLSGRR